MLRAEGAYTYLYLYLCVCVFVCVCVCPRVRVHLCGLADCTRRLRAAQLLLEHRLCGRVRVCVLSLIHI